ncbi:MAG: helix-turn-helix domain-containing protein [Lactobacillus sp.]|jgi:DNA-binding transcriptional MerR regulator|nr:helix-turn-helix domain-containing protein [Lactobacillus sp.]MCI1974224.1 helix-turn-helix domain-containing protein [Lactobacillus sp.]
MTSDRDFQALMTPREAAAKLSISVATLRKYSLIVEKVTAKHDYFQRTKQKTRLYSDQNVADLRAFKDLSAKGNLTLNEASEQVFAGNTTTTQEKVVEPKHAKPKTKHAADQNEQLVNLTQVGKLMAALQQTIASQNQAIKDLQQQVAAVQKQNEQLLKTQKELAAPQPSQPAAVKTNPKVEEMPDISGIVTKTERPVKTRAEERAEIAKQIAADRQKPAKEVHEEILAKARENEAKGTVSLHRTLSDMQIPQKQHWWERFFK